MKQPYGKLIDWRIREFNALFALVLGRFCHGATTVSLKS
jgi:hypothetical protein